MPLITRSGKGSKLTAQEMDGNLTYLEGLALGASASLPGYISGVAAGTGLTGGGLSGDVTLSIPSDGITEDMLSIIGGPTAGYILSNDGTNLTWIQANPGDITGVIAGTGLTGGGLSGDVTLNIDDTYVALKSDLDLLGASEGLSKNGSTFSLGGTVSTDITIDAINSNYPTLRIGGDNSPQMFDRIWNQIRGEFQVYQESYSNGLSGTYRLDDNGHFLTYEDTNTSKYGWCRISSSDVHLVYQDDNNSIFNKAILDNNGFGLRTNYNSDIYGYLKSDNLTTDRTYQLPNTSGTFSLTSDLVNYLPLSGGTVSGNINFGSALGLNLDTNNYIKFDDTDAYYGSYKILVKSSNGSGDSVNLVFNQYEVELGYIFDNGGPITSSNIKVEYNGVYIDYNKQGVATSVLDINENNSYLSWTDNTNSAVVIVNQLGVGITNNIWSKAAYLRNDNLTDVRTFNFSDASGTLPVYSTASVPSAANDPGKTGEIRSDSSYLYVCVADNTWIRATASAW